MFDNREKIEAVVEDSNTPSNVRATLQDILAVSDYLDSVNVDDEGKVTPKEQPSEVTPTDVVQKDREETQDERIARLEAELAAAQDAKAGATPPTVSESPSSGQGQAGDSFGNENPSS